MKRIKDPKDIKTVGNQIFNVPMNKEGRRFLSLLKKYSNSGILMRQRGRGSRKKHGDKRSISPKYAEWVAVYIEKVQPRFVPFNYDIREFLEGKKYKNVDVRAERDIAMDIAVTLEKENEELKKEIERLKNKK